jgi:hypothetical protein
MSGGICSDAFCDCPESGCAPPVRLRRLASRWEPGPGARWAAAKLDTQEAAQTVSAKTSDSAGAAITGANADATVAGSVAIAGADAKADGAALDGASGANPATAAGASVPGAALPNAPGGVRAGTTPRRPALAALALPPSEGFCGCSFGGTYPNCNGCTDPNMNSIAQDSGGTMSPGFAPGITVYTVSVANGVASVKLSALFVVVVVCCRCCFGADLFRVLIHRNPACYATSYFVDARPIIINYTCCFRSTSDWSSSLALVCAESDPPSQPTLLLSRSTALSFRAGRGPSRKP